MVFQRSPPPYWSALESGCTHRWIEAGPADRGGTNSGGTSATPPEEIRSMMHTKIAQAVVLVLVDNGPAHLDIQRRIHRHDREHAPRIVDVVAGVVGEPRDLHGCRRIGRCARDRRKHSHHGIAQGGGAGLDENAAIRVGTRDLEGGIDLLEEGGEADEVSVKWRSPKVTGAIRNR